MDHAKLLKLVFPAPEPPAESAPCFVAVHWIDSMSLDEQHDITKPPLTNGAPTLSVGLLLFQSEAGVAIAQSVLDARTGAPTNPEAYGHLFIPAGTIQAIVRLKPQQTPESHGPDETEPDDATNTTR